MAETTPDTIDVTQRLEPSDKGTPLPVFSGAEMAQALVAYKELQTALDRSMPDQIMDLDGRKFRKKGYWRAISVAFNLTIEPVEEQRQLAGTFGDGRENFGYVVTYRATAPNGRSVFGDGSCFAVEKARRFKCPHPHPSWKGKSAHWPHESCPDFDPEFQWRTLPAQATEHNVRSHAHTRAFNRAVSNLVGFGEVSAEEIDGSIIEPASPDAGVESSSTVKPPRRKSENGAGEAVISEPQAKRFHAIARESGWKEAELKTWLATQWGYESSLAIKRADYDAIIEALRTGQ